MILNLIPIKLCQCFKACDLMTGRTGACVAVIPFSIPQKVVTVVAVDQKLTDTLVADRDSNNSTIQTNNNNNSTVVNNGSFNANYA